jgi:hypothetical protein
MTRKMSLNSCWIIAVVLFLISGCSRTYSTPDYTNQMMDFAAVRSVAVLPFHNLSGDEKAGERVRDTFMGMLLATDSIYALPPGEVARGINRAGWRLPYAPTIEEVVKLQSILKVDAVITGVVREYGVVRSGSAQANLVSLSLQMIEAQTGSTVWAGSSTKGGITLADRMLGTGGRPMNDVTIQVINDLLDQLFE